MTWVASAVVAGSVIAGGSAIVAGNRAASASQGATNASIAEQQRQYDQARQDLANTRSLGNSATDALAKLYGFAVPSQQVAADKAAQPVTVGDSQLPAGTQLIPAGNGWYDVKLADGTSVGVLQPGGANGRFTSNGTPIPATTTPTAAGTAPTATGQPDMSGFFTSPDYQFNLDQTLKAGNNSLVARGRGLSGGASKELARYGSGLASSEYGNFTARLMQMAGLGSQATQGTVAAGANMANSNSAALINNGNNRASAYTTQAAGVNNAVQGGLSNYLLSNYLKPTQIPTSTPPYAMNYSGAKYGSLA